MKVWKSIHVVDIFGKISFVDFSESLSGEGYYEEWCKRKNSD